ncbi:MAG: Sua5/YciO/YrdC/YwlC family protein, partial [Synergistaceae bacterium]|nr:Sua5/YciO/YrdC/YwlC family protein [Synergistaceae bacterium]
MATSVLKVDRRNPEREIVARAAAALRDGELVVFPTETVYGLGANGLNPEAVKKIFAAKGRPADNPLILHVSGPGDAARLAVADARAAAVMEAFWPG